MNKLLLPLKWILTQTKKYRFVIAVILLSNLTASLLRIKLAVFSKELTDTFLYSRWEETIHTGILFLSILFLEIVLKILSKGLTTWNTESMANRLRTGLFKHLTKVSWIHYKKFHSGDILTRITSDAGIVTESIIKEVPEFISQGVSLIIAFIILCFYDPVLAILGMIAAPIALLAGLLLSSRFMKIYTYAQEAESKFRAFAGESLEHMLVIKTFCHEEESQKQWDSLLKKKMKLTMKRKAAMGISGLFIIFICACLYLPIIAKVIYELTKGLITYGDLAVYIQLIILMQSPLINLSTGMQQFTSAGASVKRLMELSELETEQYPDIQLNPALEKIYFNHVTFYYLEGIPVLYNINMKISSGDVIGLIGKSGEGKTTLIHLLIQILTPCLGNISVKEEEDNGAWNHAFIRKYISYVPQGNTLFSGTISQNLLIGNPDAAKEEQIAALRKAQAWEFVSDTKDGLNTLVGEKGLGLSEGQAQRIAIARALLRNVPFLILDEATSALDSETERAVLGEIIKDKSRSFIMITHRATVLSFCNRVWRLHKGVLTEEEVNTNEAAATKAT